MRAGRLARSRSRWLSGHISIRSAWSSLFLFSTTATASLVNRPVVAITRTSTRGGCQSFICSMRLAMSFVLTLLLINRLHCIINLCRTTPTKSSFVTRMTERSRPRSGAFVHISHSGFSYPWALLIRANMRRSKFSASSVSQLSFIDIVPRGLVVARAPRSSVATGMGSFS